MTRHTLIALAGCSLLAVPAFAQRGGAVPRGGGSSSDTGARHHSGSSGSPSYSSPSSSSSSSSGSAHVPSGAERRHPRAGTGRGSGGGGYWGGGGYYPGWYPGYGGGYYYPSYAWGYWWPYGAYAGPGYWGAPWGAGAVYTYVQSDRGSIRLLVDPPEARVYVDGYYAGIVDDFDGLFQRLHVAPGRHEIEVKLGGYRTYRVRVYAGSGSTLKLDHELEEGSGELFEDLAGDEPDREARYEPRAGGGENEDRSLPLAGDLRLRVDPEDASVYIDGAFFAVGREATAVSLAPGTHQVEVVRPGFRTEQREVEVRPRDVTSVTIELSRP